MIALTYQIRLNEPAIFSAIEGDPNSAVTHPYMPGSAVRGMMIGLYIRARRQNAPDFELTATGDEQSLFFSTQTRYLNAYPCINDRRSLPVPATWTTDKYHAQGENTGRTITDGAFSEQTSSAHHKKQTGFSGFTLYAGTQALIARPETVINVHTTRARRVGSDQQVFRYEALAENQVFAGAVLCDNEQDARYLGNLLIESPQVVVGGSRSAGYGSATISNVQIIRDWQEVDHQIGDETIMTFLSDALLRDSNGVYMPTADTLEAHLRQIGIQCAVKPVSIKTILVGGFNRKWGLPLPQAAAIQRGSVVRLTGIIADDNALQRLTTYGIGERIEDGFGRMALGWQQHPRLAYEKYQPDQITEKPKLSSESKRLRQAVIQRIRNLNIREDIAGGLLHDPRYRIAGGVTRSQISRLRTIIANELRKEQPSRTAIDDFLKDISGKKAGVQFENARINGQSLSEWLRNPYFELSESVTSKDQYVLQLIDEILLRAYKERQKENRQEVN